MFNAVRMDIYRLIHTKSAYVILVIAMALAIAMSGMIQLLSEAWRQRASWKQLWRSLW